MINIDYIDKIAAEQNILFEDEISTEAEYEIRGVYFLYLNGLEKGRLFSYCYIENQETKDFFKKSGFEVTDCENGKTKIKYLPAFMRA